MSTTSRKTKWMAAVAALASLALGGKYATTHATTVLIAPGSLHDRVVARAVVEPVDGVAEIRPRAFGRVLRVVVREGDSVQAGDLLADIESSELEAELSRRTA